MRGEFRVSVTKDYLVFASAHFITFAGHRCEGLHGHNYRARVTIEGDLNQESWFVFDFVELKRIMKRLCDEIDHLVLLPLQSDRVRVSEEGEVVTAHLVLGPGRGTHVRLIPLGNGYRYAGRGVWFDGIRQEATLNFGPRSSVQCTVLKQ